MTDGKLDDRDFAAVANALNGTLGPTQYQDVFQQLRGGGESGPTAAREEEEEARRQLKTTHTARSALLTMPADAERYDKVSQASLDGKALIRYDVPNFDTQGVLRIWLVWVEVQEEAAVPAGPSGQKT